MLDIAIIGAGPAGVTAGIYAARAGLKAAVFERASVGGQIISTHLMENYPAFPEGISGVDFAESIKKQALRFGVEFRGQNINAVRQETGYRVLITADGEEIQSRALIIASGAQPRKLGIPNEERFTGEGISYCATCDGAFFKERTVCVVGGGDTALEDALYLSNVASKVYLIHRRAEFRAQSVLVKRAQNCANIEFLLNKVPVGFYGDFGLDGIELKDTQSGEVSQLDVDGCFLAVGYVPDTEMLRGIVQIDPYGYIIAGEDTKTGAKGIFAAGDVRVKKVRQVVTAVSDGAAAALAAREYIEEQGFNG